MIEEAIRHGECAIERGYGFVDVFLFNDQRWSKDEVTHPCLHDDAIGEHPGCNLLDDDGLAVEFFLPGVEGGLESLVFHKLYGPEESDAADVADRRMLWLEGMEFFAEVGTDLVGAIDKIRRRISPMVATAGPRVMGCAS